VETKEIGCQTTEDDNPFTTWLNITNFEKSIRSQDTLNPVQTKVLRILANHSTDEHDDLGATIVLPKGRGQNEGAIYVKVPSISDRDRQSKGRDLVNKLIQRYNLGMEYQLRNQAKTLKLTQETVTLIVSCNINLLQYHTLRMFIL